MKGKFEGREISFAAHGKGLFRFVRQDIELKNDTITREAVLEFQLLLFCPKWIERRAKGGKVLYGLSGALGLFDKIRYPKRREDQTGNKEALILQREVA